MEKCKLIGHALGDAQLPIYLKRSTKGLITEIKVVFSEDDNEHKEAQRVAFKCPKRPKKKANGQ